MASGYRKILISVGGSPLAEQAALAIAQFGLSFMDNSMADLWLAVTWAG